MKYLKQAWLVLLLAIAFGAALAGVQVTWGPKIDANREQKARMQIPGILAGRPDLSAAEAADALENLLIRKLKLSVATPGGGETTYEVYAVSRKGAGGEAGWVVKAKGSGYADVIQLLVGLSPDGRKITGMAVLANNETPGLGNKIANAPFEEQFAGLNAETPVTVTKEKPPAGANGVQAISGATISSEAVSEIVNKAVEAVRAGLPALRKQLSEVNADGE